jgi:hypothetical protein
VVLERMIGEVKDVSKLNQFFGKTNIFIMILLTRIIKSRMLILGLLRRKKKAISNIK